MVRSGGKWFKVDGLNMKVVAGMFMGEYQHNIDSKGRLIMPAKFRDELEEIFVITKGLDGCLFVYPLSEWQQLEKKLKQLPFTRKDARAFARFFFSGAVECELDKQGRVLLPANLRNYANLKKEVVVIGLANRLEIWSQDIWEKYSNSTAENYEELAEKMVDFEIDF